MCSAALYPAWSWWVFYGLISCSQISSTCLIASPLNTNDKLYKKLGIDVPNCAIPCLKLNTCFLCTFSLISVRYLAIKYPAAHTKSLSTLSLIDYSRFTYGRVLKHHSIRYCGYILCICVWQGVCTSASATLEAMTQLALDTSRLTPNGVRLQVMGVSMCACVSLCVFDKFYALISAAKDKQ